MTAPKVVTAPKAILAMAPDLPSRIFDAGQLAELRSLVEVDPGSTVQCWDGADDARLAELEVVITGWGAPLLHASLLPRMPRLRAVVHTAGSVKAIVTPEVFDAGVLVTTAARANAVPVAEFALAEILLAGKRTLAVEQAYRRLRGGIDHFGETSALGDASLADSPLQNPRLGNYGSTVGLVSASTIGTMVAELLRPFSIDVQIHDPYASEEKIAALGARKVELDDLLATSDVVSLHTPLIPETTKLINARRLGLLPEGSTLINTARAGVVDNTALRELLATGRVSAVLDVTDPEPLPPDDPLWSLPNVRLTPHLAGSLGNELHRMGASALEEVRRLTGGRPAAYPVTRQMLATMA